MRPFQTLSRAFAFVAAAGATAAFASAYPPGAFLHHVTVFNRDPIVFAQVGNVGFTGFVLGYKNSGALVRNSGGNLPEAIDAVLRISCRGYDGSAIAREGSLTLGREWRGTGYMSQAFSMYSFQPNGCDYRSGTRVEVAFSDRRGHWDSVYGQNYVLTTDQGAQFTTQESGYGIGFQDWDIITNEMRK